MKKPRLFRREDEALVPDGGSEDGTQIEIAEKSILWLRFRVRGKQCHASTPQKGINAFEAGSHLVVRLGALAERFAARGRALRPAALHVHADQEGSERARTSTRSREKTSSTSTAGSCRGRTWTR